MLVTSDSAMSLTEVENNSHGTMAENEKTTYGMSPVSIGMNRVKMIVNTATEAAGWSTAHRPPRMDC